MPGSPKWSVSLRFPHQNPVYTSPLPNTCYMLCPSHRFDHPHNIWTGLKFIKLLIMFFPHSPVVNWSLLGPNILFNTLFSNTFSLYSSLNVSNPVSHLYNTTGESIVLNVLIFKSLDSKLEDKRFCTK